ncbi:MAG TPA: flagellar hook-length control protein FliK [Steroidobacteraceae bacterium]
MAFEGLPVSPAANLPATGNAPGGAPVIVNAGTAQGDFLAMLSQLITPAASSAAALTGPVEGVLSGTGESVAVDEDGDELLDLEEFIAGLCPAPANPLAPPSEGKTAAGTIAPITDDTSGPFPGPAAEVAQALMTDTTGTEETATSQSATSVTNAHGSPVQLLTPHHQASGSQNLVLHHELRAPVGSPAWQDQLGDHLTWMAQNNRDVASLRLNPEHLGPVEVRLSVRDGETSVWFGAANADTRAALEQSLPRLREMFASQGLSLTDAGVFRDPPREAPTQTATPSSVQPGSDEPEPVTRIALKHQGLIDTYA